MLITIAELKRIIRSSLVEWAGAPPSRMNPTVVLDPLAPSLIDREQLGSLADAEPMSRTQGISSHLLDPNVDIDDCFGPVPPGDNDARVNADPYTLDYSPLPSPTRPR